MLQIRLIHLSLASTRMTLLTSSASCVTLLCLCMSLLIQRTNLENFLLCDRPSFLPPSLPFSHTSLNACYMQGFLEDPKMKYPLAFKFSFIQVLIPFKTMYYLQYANFFGGGVVPWLGNKIFFKRLKALALGSHYLASHSDWPLINFVTLEKSLKFSESQFLPL